MTNVVLGIYIGGLIGSATFAAGNNRQKGHTIFQCAFFMLIWPLFTFVALCYLIFAQKLGKFTDD